MKWKLFVSIALISITFQLQARDQVMGYLKTDLSYFKYKDTQIAFKIWLDALAKQEEVTLRIVYYDDAQKACKDYQSKKLNSYTLNTLYYLEKMQQLDAITQEYWVMLKINNTPDRLLLLVSSNGKIKTIKDLKNKVIALQSDNLMGKIFLEKELLKNVQKTPKDYINAYFNTHKNSTAILKTFFQKVDACIVPESTFNMAVELNPTLKRSLHILKATPNIYFPNVMLIRKDTPEPLLKKFKHGVANLNNTSQGRNLKDFFKMTSFWKATPEYIDLLKNYYKEYKQLKKSLRNE